jgi:flagellar hook-associated protein 3 FlgL
MRVTGNMMSNEIIQNLNIDLARLANANEEVSTGKRINRPSDDPQGTQQVVNINEALAGIDQYQRNASFVTNWTDASEGALSGVGTALQRANTLAIRAANDVTLNQQEKDTIADEVNSILEQLVSAGNTRLEGKSIFGGYQTSGDAFTTTVVGGEITAVTYSGDSGVDQVEIDQGLVVNKNVTGDNVFQPGAGVDVFQALIDLRDNLRANNTAGISAGITNTDQAHQQVVEQVSMLGNKTNTLEMAGENISAKKTGLVKLNSSLADADMPDAIVRLQTAQNVLDSALQSSARILQQQTLADFLG